MDLQRNKSFLIPNSMVDLINSLDEKLSYENIYSKFSDRDKIVVDEYLDFLLKNDLGFFADEDEAELFPELDRKVQFPAHVTNMVIELSPVTIHSFDKIIEGIEKISVSNIQLISYDAIVMTDLLKLLSALHKCSLHSVELLLQHSNELVLNIDKIDDALADVTQIVFHSAPISFRTSYTSCSINVIYTHLNISNIKFCGLVNLKDFSTNQNKVLESMMHNSCLHKKISVNIHGDIKNCPATIESFGNIKNMSVEHALNHTDAKKYWHITKDEIKVCKDCEFRHICTDCRAYLEDPHDIYSKPLKCGYDPYTNVWQEWSANPLKAHTIEFYEMQDLVKTDE